MADLSILEGPSISVTLSSAASAARGTRLTLASTGLYAAAAIGVKGEAVTEYTIAASGSGTARLLNAPGTQIYQTTAAVIAIGDPVYTAASGLVSSTSTSAVLLGVARTAVASPGGLVEVITTS